MANNDSGSFPEDLARDVLLRLPVKSLLRCKRVCKNWYALIKSPSFIREHLNKDSVKNPQLLIYDYGAPVNSPPITLINSDNDGTLVINSLHNYYLPSGVKELIGSVDGLFLIERDIDIDGIYKGIQLALWNPATREVRPLPAPNMEFRPFRSHNSHLGFGLDPLTRDYKVVYIQFISDEYAALYSTSRDSWRIFVKPKIPMFTDCIAAYGSGYLNGAYYWALRLTDEGCYTILSFNFGSEVFEEIKGPDTHGFNTANTEWATPILLDESIALLTGYESSVHDVWAMIQPGVWNKLFTLPYFPHIRSWYSTTAIFVTEQSCLVSYDVRSQETRQLGFRHQRLKRESYEHGCGVYYYKESLVTIKRGSREPDHCSFTDIFDSLSFNEICRNLKCSEKQSVPELLEANASDLLEWLCEMSGLIE